MAKTIKILLTVIGAGLILNAAAKAILTNFNFGIIMTLGAGLIILLYGLFFHEINAASQKGFFMYIKYCVFLCFILGAALITFISIYGHTDTVTYKEDALIVLGAGIRGERVTMPLAYRLDKAVEYSVKNPDAVIIVSGGQGPQEDITEALAMERYMVAKGVDQNKIIKEEKASSTYENFVYSKEILDDLMEGPYKTVFITNNFHLYRASRLSEYAGIESARLHCGLEWYSIPSNYLRECAAVIKLWVFKK